MRTKQELIAEATKIEADIAAGKVSAKKLQSSKARARILRLHASGKMKNAGAKKAAPKATKAVKAVSYEPVFSGAKAKAVVEKTVASKQPQLPKFLEQMPNPRIDEIIAERINQALQKAIETQVDAALAKLLPFKRA